jgi:hypothetical protein
MSVARRYQMMPTPFSPPTLFEKDFIVSAKVSYRPRDA